MQLWGEIRWTSSWTSKGNPRRVAGSPGNDPKGNSYKSYDVLKHFLWALEVLCALEHKSDVSYVVASFFAKGHRTEEPAPDNGSLCGIRKSWGSLSFQSSYARTILSSAWSTCSPGLLIPILWRMCACVFWKHLCFLCILSVCLSLTNLMILQFLWLKVWCPLLSPIT